VKGASVAGIKTCEKKPGEGWGKKKTKKPVGMCEKIKGGVLVEGERQGVGNLEGKETLRKG